MLPSFGVQELKARVVMGCFHQQLFLAIFFSNLVHMCFQHSTYYRQFNCSDSLIYVFNCPLEARLMNFRFAALWSQYNYLFYVVEGRKIWHTAHNTYDIGKETCVFVRKGAWIFENFI